MQPFRETTFTLENIALKNIAPEHLTYTVYHRDILETAKFLYCDRKHMQHMHYEFEEKWTRGNRRMVHESFETDWWKNTEVRLSGRIRGYLIR
jgi:Plavaka transposase